MTTLSNLTIAISATHHAFAAGPASVLERAGAETQYCSPRLDLWAALADRTFDAIVIVAGHEAEPLAAYAPLHNDPRSKAIPCVILWDPMESLRPSSFAGFTSFALLSASCEASELVRTVAELVEIRQRTLQYQQELRELSESLRNETERADELAKRLGNISHDLRNMLGVAYGFACNLRDGVVPPGSTAHQTHVQRITEAIENATALLESLATAPVRPSLRAPRRLSSQHPERIQRTHVQVAKIAREVMALLEQRAEGHQVQLKGQLDQSVVVWADALKLKQVILNLVDNAIKYGAQGGEVTVNVNWAQPSPGAGKQSRRLAQISVSDRGPGIPESLRERVFERGFRGEQQEPGTGQGIGLNLVRDIVVQHGGSIQCEEAPNSGTLFRVSLPPDLRERDRGGGSPAPGRKPGESQ